MKKLLFMLILVITLIFISYKYLLIINSSKIPYINTLDDVLIYQIKNIELYEIEDFDFDNYFRIISFNNHSYDYKFDDDYLYISIKTNNDTFRYKYPYTILEKEVIIETIIETKYIEKETSNISNPSTNKSSSTVTSKPTVNNDYMNISSTSYSFKCGTDLSTIISTISSNIDSSVQVSLDYSSLNPYIEGTYTVVLSSKIKNISINVQIY